MAIGRMLRGDLHPAAARLRLRGGLHHCSLRSGRLSLARSSARFKQSRGSDRCPGRRPSSHQRSDGRPRRARQPGGRLRVAHRRDAAFDPGLVAAPVLGRRQIGEKQAHGILVAALGMLAGHYGYSARKPAESRFKCRDLNGFVPSSDIRGKAGIEPAFQRNGKSLLSDNP
jgi:hypothetical protein